MKHSRIAAAVFVLILFLSNLHPGTVSAGETRTELDLAETTTGILYDRVLPLSRMERFDGSEASPPVSLKLWRQIAFEIERASLDESRNPVGKMLEESRRRPGSGEFIPVAVLNVLYNRFSEVDGEKPALDEARIFAAAPLTERTYRGGHVRFLIDRSLYRTNDERPVRVVEIDFDDSAGFRPVRFGEAATVRYFSAGTKEIRLRLTVESGETLHTRFPFLVKRLVAPLPDDTLSVQATVPYNGQYGSGEAFIYLADSHATLTNPVVVVEGFDLDNSMNWDELYELLNQENLIEDLRSEGFDAVVLNFTDAVDYIQRNSYVITELIDRVQSEIDPASDMVLIGPSMGGLASRYALAWMENEGIDHRVRTFISFDSPHRGADIPLGLQYWVSFFSGQSADAAYILGRLNTPAARQMLVYHLTDPPGTTGESDSLFGGFEAELAAIGGWPSLPRKVAVANGSGAGTGQGFAPGDQIVHYVYETFLVDIIGNVWAVPDEAVQTIFDDLIDIILLPQEEMTVTVSGTAPYDNAPGGSRTTMADLDSTDPGYGDIVALHPSHCFIPTISALAIDTSDLFFNVGGDPDVLSRTPFDAIYYPAENQEHVLITPESKGWFISEIRPTSTTVEEEVEPLSGLVRLLPNRPNPFNPITTIRYELSETGHVRLTVYDVRGREVDLLVDGERSGGYNEEFFRPGRLPGGVYFYRLEADGVERVRKMILLR